MTDQDNSFRSVFPGGMGLPQATTGEAIGDARAATFFPMGLPDRNAAAEVAEVVAPRQALGLSGRVEPVEAMGLRQARGLKISDK